MHPIGVILLLVMLYFVAFSARRSALIAMVAGVLYLTQGQSIDVFGLNLFAVRVLGLVLFVRVLARREFLFSDLNRIDHAVLMLYAYTTVVFLLRSSDGHAAAIALALDACFCYFGFRGLVTREADLRWLLRILVVLLVPYVFLIGIERVTGNNPFMFMGGISGGWVRDGATRCMGSFRYPVSLGTFAASFLALYIGQWHSKADRKYAWFGIGFCLWIVWATNSGGSLSAAAVALVGWMFWYARKDMRLVRWGIVGVLVALAFAMKAPVWYILTRGPFGGDSWHRAYLIDVALRNIGKWWFAGMSLQETANWFHHIINEGADITNHYLVFGLSAGVGAIVLLIVLLSRAFRLIGAAFAKLRAAAAGESSTGFMLWGLGVMMTVHVINWLGVSYFDQVYVVWFFQLAAVASITAETLRRREQLPLEPMGLPKPAAEFAHV